MTTGMITRNFKLRRENMLKLSLVGGVKWFVVVVCRSYNKAMNLVFDDSTSVLTRIGTGRVCVVLRRLR
jgi:hypothetical protein